MGSSVYSTHFRFQGSGNRRLCNVNGLRPVRRGCDYLCVTASFEGMSSFASGLCLALGGQDLRAVRSEGRLLSKANLKMPQLLLLLLPLLPLLLPATDLCCRNGFAKASLRLNLLRSVESS